MIRQVETSKGTSAITSDKWHVVHSHFISTKRKRPFAREVVSEHESSKECRTAAATLREKIDGSGLETPEAQRDEVFACKPNFKSLKHARRRKAEPRSA